MSQFEISHSVEVEVQEDAAKKYYDDSESQLFYQNIFGDTGIVIHNGRHDVINADPSCQDLPTAEKSRRAMVMFEDEFVELVKKTVGVDSLSIVEMGSGFNALLRRFAKSGGVKYGCGVDLSSEMTTRADNLDAEFMKKENIKDCRLETRTESYVSTSLEGDTMDVAISLDSFLHVGPDIHRECMKEAFRVLKPGGWVIFTDIMQRPGVDPAVMKPIYDRLNLPALGSVENYHKSGEVLGFINRSFVDLSSNIAPHYSNVKKVLIERTSHGCRDKIPLSQGFIERMSKGTQHWIDLAPDNMKWGIILMQKPAAQVPLPL